MGSQATLCGLVTFPQWCLFSKSGEEKVVGILVSTYSRGSGLTKHSICASLPPAFLAPLLSGRDFCNSLTILVNRLKWK